MLYRCRVIAHAILVFVSFLCFSQSFANPDPNYDDALWVGGDYKISRYPLATLTPNLAFTNTSDETLVIATDTKMGRLWAVSRDDISIYDFTGQLLFNIPYTSTGSSGTINDRSIAIDPVTSAAWIGTGYHLYQYTSSGTLSQTYAANEIKDLSIDVTRNELWVALKTQIEIRDLTTGAVLTSFTPGPCTGIEKAVFDPVLSEVWLLNCGKLNRYNRAGQNTLTTTTGELNKLALSINGVWVSDQELLYRVDNAGQIVVQVNPIQTWGNIRGLIGG